MVGSSSMAASVPANEGQSMASCIRDVDGIELRVSVCVCVCARVGVLWGQGVMADFYRLAVAVPTP